MKKILILLLTVLILTSCTSCAFNTSSNTEHSCTYETVTETVLIPVEVTVPVEVVETVLVPVEITVPTEISTPTETVVVEVEKEVIKEVEIVKTETAIVEKEVTIPIVETVIVEKPVISEVVVEKEIPVVETVVVEKIVEKEVVKTEIVEVEKEVIVGRNITYGDSENVLTGTQDIYTVGTEYPYLAVCYGTQNTLTLLCSTGLTPYLSDFIKDYSQQPIITAVIRTSFSDYSVFKYSNKYDGYIGVAAGGICYLDDPDVYTQSAEEYVASVVDQKAYKYAGWSSRYDALGHYDWILTNVKVEVVEKGTNSSGRPYRQVIISYEKAYTIYELLGSAD